MSQPFRYYLRIRYSECDGQKIVFNSRYGDYIDLATSELVRALHLGESLISGDFDYRLVKQTTEWYAPASFDQVLEISCYTHHLGTTSFGITSEFRIAGTTDLITKSETIYVLVDAKTYEKRPLTDRMKEMLRQGAADKLTDHAAHFSENGPSFN